MAKFSVSNFFSKVQQELLNLPKTLTSPTFYVVGDDVVGGRNKYSHTGELRYVAVTEKGGYHIYTERQRAGAKPLRTSTGEWNLSFRQATAEMVGLIVKQAFAPNTLLHYSPSKAPKAGL